MIDHENVPAADLDLKNRTKFITTTQWSMQHHVNIHSKWSNFQRNEATSKDNHKQAYLV